MVSYTMELDVVHPGRLVIDVDWTANRMLTLVLERPGEVAIRRTGLPPQVLRLDLRREDLPTDDESWTLRVRGLPSRHGGPGTLRIAMPDGLVEAESTAAPLRSVEPEPTFDEPWAKRRTAPSNASAGEVQLFDSAERFRRLVVDSDDVAPDTCRWQNEFMRYIATTRDRYSDSGSLPSPETSRFLRRVAGAVDRVEGLRTSDDPLMNPPDTDNRMQYRAWLVVFHSWTDPVRGELDILLHDVQHTRSPGLVSEDWPARFLSCLIACERHFEERRSEGEMASNHQLASDQWERILVAGDALRSLSALAGPLE
jgi:hypothetical protein